jgi:hypothetical protein
MEWRLLWRKTEDFTRGRRSLCLALRCISWFSWIDEENRLRSRHELAYHGYAWPWTCSINLHRKKLIVTMMLASPFINNLFVFYLSAKEFLWHPNKNGENVKNVRGFRDSEDSCCGYKSSRLHVVTIQKITMWMGRMELSEDFGMVRPKSH